MNREQLIAMVAGRPSREKIGKLAAEVVRLQGLIKQVEWGMDPDDPKACPWCGGGFQPPDFHFGHAADCPAFWSTP